MCARLTNFRDAELIYGPKNRSSQKLKSFATLHCKTMPRIWEIFIIVTINDCNLGSIFKKLKQTRQKAV
jgi:hypothetical protein